MATGIAASQFTGVDFLNLDSLLSEDERAVRDTVRTWVDENLIPVIGQAYIEGKFPKQLVPGMAELGLFGANLPEEYGCVGLTEPDYGSNPGGMVTTARETRDGWVINGTKMWITNGSQATVSIIWAKTGDVKDPKSIRGFIVPTDTAGYAAKDQKGKLSLRASDTSEIHLQDVHLPKDAILPKSGGLKSPLMCLTQARYGISWGALGAAIGCYEEALSYAKTRVMFDKPIAQTQIQQVRLVDMLTEIVKAQFMTLQLGRLKDGGTMLPEQVSLCKRNNVNMACDIAREARRLLGANGILVEYHSMRHMANLESVYTYEGTHDMHSLIVGQAITGLAAFQ